METEKCQIEALTRDIEQSRAELKEQEDDFKYQLQKQEQELTRISIWLQEHQAEFKVCLSKKEQLERKYDNDVKKLLEVTKKQDDIEAVKRLDIETLQATNKKLTETVINKESELQDTRDQLQKVEDKLAKDMEEKDEVIVSLQQAVEVRSEIVSQMKQALDQQMMRANERLEAKQKQINELVEKLQVEEAQRAIYKQDFETERNDRQKLHQSFTDLQGHCESLKQKLTEEEEKFTTAQKQYHELQQLHVYEADKKQLISEYSKLIASFTDEEEKTKREFKKAKEQFSKEKTKLEKRIKELEQGETDRVKEMEEEIQVLTAQVNAYSREVDKQKGLVTQSQEKHKTEVIQLKEKLKSEMKSKTTEHRNEKQQLVSKTIELERNLTAELKSKGQQQQQISELNKRVTNEVKAKQELTQQFDTLSANYQKLLTTYHEERAMVTKLEDKIEKMKEVLRSKILQQVNTTDPRGIREPQHPHYPLPPNIAVRPSSTPAPVPEPLVQSDDDGMLVVSKTEGVTPSHHTDSASVPDDSPAFMSKEEMARMFKSHNQQGSSDWNQSPQQVEDSLLKEEKIKELAMKADDAILEVERMRRQGSNFKQKLVHQQTNNDSDTQDESRPKGQLIKEIEEMADEVRKASRGPNTDEVIFNDDPNDDRPYDPNLVCPRCGKQYRVGEIQKLRRHINEFCTGIR